MNDTKGTRRHRSDAGNWTEGTAFMKPDDRCIKVLDRCCPPEVQCSTRGDKLSDTHHMSSESSSHSAPYLHVLHLVNFLPPSEPEPSSSTGHKDGNRMWDEPKGPPMVRSWRIGNSKNSPPASPEPDPGSVETHETLSLGAAQQRELILEP